MPHGNGESSEKESRAGRDKLAAEKTKITETCKFGLKDLKRAGGRR